jgi:hypothetical protein
MADRTTTEIPEKWLRAGMASRGMLSEKQPDRVWLTATPTAIAVPVDNTNMPFVGGRPEPTEAMQRFQDWRELL